MQAVEATEPTVEPVVPDRRREAATRDSVREDGLLSDDALMIRLQEGDHAAFDELVVRYNGPLTGYFVNKLRDRSLAEDLVQETLVRVFDKSWDYVPLGRFKGWLFRIAHNLTVDTVRRQSRDVVLTAYRGFDEDERDRAAQFADSLLPPDLTAASNERAEKFLTLVQALPEVQRETVLLHYYNGVPLPEVAQVMETNLSTCKSRLRLAREKLIGQIEAAGLGP